MKRYSFNFAILAFAILAAFSSHAQQFVVHEWGTFTSVQGSDGVLLDWRPLLTSDLPKFVYDRSKRDIMLQTSSYHEKFGINARQRMETPVIYFYTDEETVVDVSVKFPQGLITEWYPRVRDFGPWPSQPGKPAPALKDGFLRWGKVKLFPAEKNLALKKELLTENIQSHYWPARETDAAYVRICNTGVNNVTTYEHEKFLFYRGVGSFSTPMKVSTQSSAGGMRAILENTGTAELSGLIVMTLRDGKGQFQKLNPLKGGESIEAALEDASRWMPKSDLTASLTQAMLEALTAQGLYKAEALAMVKTWQDSWFEEDGTRVFYLLPQAWTDGALPLSLNPAPKEVIRVMVGRAELLTSDMEKTIEKNIAALSDSSFDLREQAAANLKKLGRFTEPALKRVAASSTDPEVKNRAGDLLKALARVSAR
jgi:hypothetical protein